MFRYVFIDNGDRWYFSSSSAQSRTFRSMRRPPRRRYTVNGNFVVKFTRPLRPRRAVSTILWSSLTKRLHEIVTESSISHNTTLQQFKTCHTLKPVSQHVMKTSTWHVFKRTNYVHQLGCLFPLSRYPNLYRTEMGLYHCGRGDCMPYRNDTMTSAQSKGRKNRHPQLQVKKRINNFRKSPPSTEIKIENISEWKTVSTYDLT